MSTARSSTRCQVVSTRRQSRHRTRSRARRDPARPFVIGYVGSFYYSPEMRASVMERWWQGSGRPTGYRYTPAGGLAVPQPAFFLSSALRTCSSDGPKLPRQRYARRFVGDLQDLARSTGGGFRPAGCGRAAGPPPARRVSRVRVRLRRAAGDVDESDRRTRLLHCRQDVRVPRRRPAHSRHRDRRRAARLSRGVGGRSGRRRR